MRSWRVLLVFVLLFPPAHSAACSMASNGPDRDLPPLVRESEQVFVARLTGYSRFVPFGSQHYMGRMDYVLLEPIKGRPAQQGMLFEWTGEPAVEGVAPGPACGPWLVAPHNAGGKYLVFASRYPPSRRLVPHFLSIRLEPETAESARLHQLVRTLQQYESTP